MANQINQDEFEAFLQQQVKNQRMYPSDAVWRNISKELHVEKKWPALTIAAFSFLIVSIGIGVYFSPKPNIFVSENIANTAPKQDASQIKNQNNLSSAAPYLSAGNNLEKIAAPAIRTMVAVDKLEVQVPTPTVVIETNFDNQQPFASIEKVNSGSGQKKVAKIIYLDKSLSLNTSIGLNPIEYDKSLNYNENDLLKIEGNKLAKADQIKEPTKDPSDKNIADKFLKEHAADLALFTVAKQKNLKNKLSFQVYLTPSASFRKLSENHALAYLNSQNAGGPIAVNYVADVNKIVRHTPGIGIEIGGSVLYNVSDKFRVKTGLQFNMRQYKIEAYKGTAELATIALIHNSFVDSVNSIAVYRTTNGYSPTELVNRYFQISMPIGFEYEVMGNDYIQLNVAATVQPTYLLNRNAYLLTTNFKNYTESSGMIRQWNINSNIEAFITIKSGDFKWQFGPQLRYQHMPTFITAYPINEHLMDYGLKLGFSKVIK